MPTILNRQVTLILTSEEAEWLHIAMQNPLCGEHPQNETPEDAAMRLAFFEATK